MDEQLVDLMTGAHLQPPYAAINPNCLVPMLEDGDLKLTESSAILKYLADKIGSPTYPKDLKARAKVNEMMDWINTNFYRDWGYGLCLSATVPPSQAPQRRGAGLRQSSGARKTPRTGCRCSTTTGSGRTSQYLCGNEITIADYFGERHRDARRGDRLRLLAPTPTSSAGSAT